MIPEITLTTPALLFPAISLLLVAYTNRFNVIASRIRAMSASYRSTPNQMVLAQIESLRKRLFIIRNMQGYGVGSLFLCVLCMFALFAGEMLLGKAIFAISLVAMLVSLAYSLREIVMSVQAMDLELSEIEKKQ